MMGFFNFVRRVGVILSSMRRNYATPASVRHHFDITCRGILLIWKRVGQGPTALAVGAGGGCLDIFTLLYPFSILYPSLWETARYRLKNYRKGPHNPKQPTNQSIYFCSFLSSFIHLPFSSNKNSNVLI